MTEIPVIIVGGYLGAGKTTLINTFLREPKGLRCSVLVNDFGSINIDAGLIASHDGDTIALTNGCACCSIGDDLIGAAQSVVSRTDKLDLVVVEASGVAHPGRMQMMLLGVSGLATARSVTVINAANAVSRAKDKYVGSLFKSQIAQSDFVTVNRSTSSVENQEFIHSLTQGRIHASGIHDIFGASIEARIIEAETQHPPHAEDLHKRRIHDFRNPVYIEDLKLWLAERLSCSERVKGVVETIEVNGRKRKILVNASKGDRPQQFEDAPMHVKPGTLVSIGLGPVDKLSCP